MSLPPGVFWCWRQFAGESICVSEELPVAKRGWWCGVDDWDEMRPPAFRHIHGVVPKPGWALKLDGGDWPPHCPLCEKPLGWSNSVGLWHCCGSVHRRSDVLYHARILDRKRLEGKP